MIYDYINTKPPLDEVYEELEHGWLRDTAKKVSEKAHKYIKRWKDEYGKWRYQYYVRKNKKIESDVKAAKEKYGLKGVTRDARSQGKILKQRKKWNSSGRKSAYKTRKSQIRAARGSAKKSWSKSAYRVRKDKISTARSNAKKSYNERMLNAGLNAYKSHNSRKSQIKDTRAKQVERAEYKKKVKNLNNKAKTSNYWRIRKNAETARYRRKLS